MIISLEKTRPLLSVPRLLMALGMLAVAVPGAALAQVTVTAAGSKPPTTGPADNFTGSVQVSGRFQGTPPARISGGTVRFAPGARTAWHTHPLGQTLIVTEGVGLVQEWDRPVKEIRVGDTVWIPPGVKHWHGASPSDGMVHVAIAEALDGKTVEWMEQLSDEEYRRLQP